MGHCAGSGVIARYKLVYWWLLNDAGSSSGHRAWNERFINEWKRIWKEMDRPNLRNFHICLDGLKIIGQGDSCSYQDLNPKPYEYETDMITTLLRRSVTQVGIELDSECLHRINQIHLRRKWTFLLMEEFIQ
jgi:hypothetical protein